MNDFKKEYTFHKQAVDAAVASVLQSGRYILGPHTERFESAFAQYIGVKYCIGVGNGLEALQISLMALGVGVGDEVITVSHSAVATTLAITSVGATPVFVDTDEYFHLDADSLELCITSKTKAIIPVHLFGQAADMDKILAIANKHNVAVIEDACQSAGARYNGRKTGSFGTLGCFSFYPTKNLGGYGDGGAIVTDSKELYEKCKILRNYGAKDRYHHEALGINSRLDELQAAILSAKLTHLDMMTQKRNRIANMYIDGLSGVAGITLPKVRKNGIHAFHLFVIQTNRRDELMKHLRENGIQSLIHYPVPIHKQTCYPAYNATRLIHTEEIAGHILSLPLHPFMTDEEVTTVIAAVRTFLAGK